MTLRELRIREQHGIALERIPDILRKVAAATEIPATKFCGETYYSNHDPRTWARVLSMACCVAAGIDFDTTARAFYRDRTTVHKAIYRLAEKWERDEEFREIWKNLTGKETSPGKLIRHKRGPRPTVGAAAASLSPTP